MRRPSSTQKAQKAAGRGLDWLNLFVANVQTGFGPFLSVYLTTAGWTQTSIGLALSLGTVTAMASQVPAGALVDAVRRKSLVALFSILAFTASALFFTIAPIPLFVYLGQVLHAFSSCTLGPTMVALSLAVVGQSALALRLGRNARFGAIGNAMGAALMGACGYYISERSVFFVTAVLTIPALAALLPLARFEKKATPLAQPAERSREERPRPLSVLRVVGDRRACSLPPASSYPSLEWRCFRRGSDYSRRRMAVRRCCCSDSAFCRCVACCWRFCPTRRW